MKKVLEKFAVTVIHLFCIVALIELGVNYSAFYFLFPIKNDSSFGYIARKSGETIIPLGKYSSRFKAQLALPYELTRAKLTSKIQLTKSYDKNTQRYGFVDSNNNLAIDYNFVEASNFENEYAVVAIKENKTKKYGTIDKHGKWIIEAKYEYLCPFSKYYTKACIDKKHCGVIDRFGNEITLMSYKMDKLSCNGDGCNVKLCSIGKDKNMSCDYFHANM